MLTHLYKWFIFPLIGLVLALFFQYFAWIPFQPEEVTFDSKKTMDRSMEGTTGVTWNGKEVLSIQAEARFTFFLSQPYSQVLQIQSRSVSPQTVEGIRIFINDVLYTDLHLRSQSGSYDQQSIVPYHLLRKGSNTLTLIRPQKVAAPLYLESLKIRNYKGYSTGLLTAYILPSPLNPVIRTWSVGSHPNLLISFMIVYGLFGFLYGLLLAYRYKWPWNVSFGKAAWSLLPSVFLAAVIAGIPLIISDYIALTLKSFIILNALLTGLTMFIHLGLLKPLSRLLKNALLLIRQKEVLTILLILAGIFLSILFLYSLKFDKNITGFMVIGDYFEAPQVWTPKTLVHQGSVGYDGQFYYYIAHDPFITAHVYNHIDFPAYRYQRIVYPLCAWILSCGQTKIIPYMMVLVNLLAILLGTYFVANILKYFQRSSWWSLCYAFFWGLLLCLLRCLPEPLAVAFLVIAVWAYLQGRWLALGISLSLAALTQETTLLVGLAFLFYIFREKNFRKLPYIGLPFLAYGLWQVYIFTRFKTFSFLGGTQNFGIPFWGILQKLINLSGSPASFETAAEFLYLVMVVFLIPIAFSQVFKKKDPFTLSFAGYALETAFLNQLIWVEPWSYCRATLGLLLFNLLIFTKQGRWLNLWPMLLGSLIFFLSLISMKLL